MIVLHSTLPYLSKLQALLTTAFYFKCIFPLEEIIQLESFRSSDASCEHYPFNGSSNIENHEIYKAFEQYKWKT